MDSSDNFEWQRQLRYYWDVDLDDCVARMALSQYVYGYEYLGACPRLVITPLTVNIFTFLLRGKIFFIPRLIYDGEFYIYDVYEF